MLIWNNFSVNELSYIKLLQCSKGFKGLRKGIRAFMESKRRNYTILGTKVKPMKSLQNIPITRGGQDATLVNSSFFEADTTFKCLKLHLVLTLPSRDSFFQDPPNGKLKKEMIFIVDNEPR